MEENMVINTSRYTRSSCTQHYTTHSTKIKRLVCISFGGIKINCLCYHRWNVHVFSSIHLFMGINQVIFFITRIHVSISFLTTLIFRYFCDRTSINDSKFTSMSGNKARTVQRKIQQSVRNQITTNWFMVVTFSIFLIASIIEIKYFENVKKNK